MHRADANCENLYARFLRLFCFLDRITAQLFAVGENNEGAVAHRAFAKRLYCQRDRFANVGAPFRNRLGVEIVDRFDRSIVINRQRRLQERPPRECDQTGAIALQFCDQILRRQFYALQPIGRDVVRQHAARGIDREKQIEAATFYVLVGVTPARFRQCRNRQRQRKQNEPETDRTSHAIDITSKL
ncbi:MAG: hypothetical protein DME45_08110 [Verrucomicrobia bacterium]|nr:MAG: hypothetical protein DME45_08110 [Verrucomicrobiota bacterium]